MNKEELIDAIAAETEFSKKDTGKYLDAFLKVVPDALAKGESLQLIGFANFSVVDRAERQGRNPRTGKALTIAASKVVKFSAGKALKDAVNHNKEEKPAAKTAVAEKAAPKKKK
jgi:DNA-binding protein HU-beta